MCVCVFEGIYINSKYLNIQSSFKNEYLKLYISFSSLYLFLFLFHIKRKMKFKNLVVGILVSIVTSTFTLATDLTCSEDTTAFYTSTENTASTLQGLIDQSALSG